MPTPRAPRMLRLAALSAVVALACAKASPSTQAPTATRTIPPRLLTRVYPPDIVVSQSNAAGRPSLKMRIQVMVDSLGQADVRTLKLTGIVETQNRHVIERWLQGLRFRPAMRDGQPVSGLYDLTMTVRVILR